MHRQGKFDEALECERKTLAIMEKLDGKGKLAQAGVHLWLGKTLRKQGKLNEAEAEYREAIAIGTREVGEDYLDLPEFFAELGAVLAEQGKFAEARERAQQAVDICQRHPDQIEHAEQVYADKTLRFVMDKIAAADALVDKPSQTTDTKPEKTEHAK